MESNQYLGFLYQTGYSVEQKRVVIHISGRLIDGRSFLIRETRQDAFFYVRDSDIGHPALRKCKIIESDVQTLDGHVASRVYCSLTEMLRLRDTLHAEGRLTYEADLRFPVSFLIGKNIRGGIQIRGVPDPTLKGADLVFTDPDLLPAKVQIEPRVLSFDIETDPEARNLLAIAIYGLGIDEVLLVDETKRQVPEKVKKFANEREAIEAFVARVSDLDPDVLTGWNVVDFDVRILSQIARRNKTTLRLGRTDSEVRTREARGYFGSSQAIVHGRVILDGIDLLRGAFVQFPDYSLDSVAREVLGEGKAVEGDVRNRAQEILDRYHNDLEGFVRYASTDARLALEILEQLQLIPLAFKRSSLTGMTVDRVAASVASFDFVYLSKLRPKKLCAPSVNSAGKHYRERHSGGLVLQPEPGMYSNVWLFDYTSLYPSVIRTFNIDPVSYIARDAPESAIETTNKAHFSREKAILPEVLDDLFEERQRAKSGGDVVASQAIKILMNSFYGVLATPLCRFHNPRIANAVTSLGRYFLRYAKDWFEQLGFSVLYGDTDSVFVRSNQTTLGSSVYALGKELTGQFNFELSEHIQERWSVESKINLEFQNLYTKFFLPAMRRSDQGARKRYAGLDHLTRKVEFTGMEVVRRDWTELAKEVQRELFGRLFTEEPVENYLRNCVDAVRKGEFDSKLVYRKGLRKRLNQYKKVIPPHVAAARKLENPGYLIDYIITVDGPEPVEHLEHPLDREHYVQRQIRPVAEPVLKALGLDFDAVAERFHQPDLLAEVFE